MKIIVISGPSGSGKTTIIKNLLTQKELYFLEFSISTTTRLPRNNEVHGKDYYFVNKHQFANYKKNNYFLETTQVIKEFYGTSLEEISRIQQKSKIPILDIDPEGVQQIKKKLACLKIFILPPSLNILSERLSKRQRENPKNKLEISKRIKLAEKEMKYQKLYDYSITNQNLEDTIKQIKKLIIYYHNLQ